MMANVCEGLIDKKKLYQYDGYECRDWMDSDIIRESYEKIDAMVKEIEELYRYMHGAVEKDKADRKFAEENEAWLKRMGLGA